MASTDNLKRPSPDTKIRTRSGAFLNSPEDLEACPLCQDTQLALVVAQEHNEYLMRGFSGIFTQLDSAKDFVKSIEEICRQHERIPDHIHDTNHDIYIIDPAEIAAKRGSRNISHEVVEQMFPKGLELSDVEHELSQLDKCLSKMRELCMSFANSCFEGGTALTQTLRPPLKRFNTIHSSSFSQTLDLSSSLDEGASRHPLMHNYSEYSPRQPSPSPLRRTHSETELNITSLSTSFSADPLTSISSKLPPSSSSTNNFRISYPSGSSLSKNSTPKYDRVVSTPGGGGAAPFRSHLMSVLGKQQTYDSSMMRSLSNSTVFLGTLRSQTLERKVESVGGTLGQPSLEEGLSGLESMQLFEKITTLEQERLSFVTKNEELNNQNKALWLAINEMGQDLDRKHLELHLLKADIKKATTQLRLAAEHRDELIELKTERDRLKEKSTSLEDESRLVKDSLVHRLTQMAATNKVLSLDNQRLRSKIVQLRSSTAPPLSNQSSATDIRIEYEEEGTAVVVGGNDEIQLQGALMELDDSGGGYVHKQGFLVKQGHKVKNWRKRMFVLDTHALSYYKTEQPLGTLPLSEIQKVQIAQGQTSKPNMFEIHRLEGKKDLRVYYLSAPSQEEMESWIGIIQTLKDTRERTTRTNTSPPHTNQGTTITTATTQQGSSYPSPVLQSSMKNRSHTTLHAPPLTMPRIDSSWESSTHLRVDDGRVGGGGGGVRNRMFTEGGQRRQDLIIHMAAMDTSDEEELDKDIRSPFPGTASSDEEGPRGERILLTTLPKK